MRYACVVVGLLIGMWLGYGVGYWEMVPILKSTNEQLQIQNRHINDLGDRIRQLELTRQFN